MIKTRRYVRLLCFLIGILACICPVAVSAETETPSLTEDAGAVYLLHLETDSTILEKNANQVIHAGSTVKIMSGLIACEKLASRLQEQVYITHEMVAASSGYRLYIQAGDIFTVEQLLYAAICASYNDAYDVLAFYVSGSVDAFLQEMNRRASDMGAKNTVFTDPSGIDDNSKTSATELALIAKEAFQNELYMQISSTARYHFAGSEKLDARTFYNRNALISTGNTTQYYNTKCRGMNAGYTARGGHCVVTVASDEGDHYISIVMGANETEETSHGYVITNNLIKWVNQTYSYMEVITPDTVVCTIPVTVSDLTNEVEVRTHESFTCHLPADAVQGQDITYSVRLLYPSLEAPVAQGLMVGYVAIMYQGKNLGTLPLYTAAEVARSPFIGGLKGIQSLTQSRAFCAGAIFFGVVLTAWIVTEYILFQRRRHKWDKYFSMKMNPAPNSLKSNPQSKRKPHS